jgi:hypothetical protein
MENQENITRVNVIFANPYNVKLALNTLHAENLIEEKYLNKLQNFCDKNFELNVHPLNKLGNYDNVYTNGKIFCLAWVASQEDKALCFFKLNKFFREEYQLLDIQKQTLLTRIL